MEMLKIFLWMLWLPNTWRILRDLVFGPRSPGFGGAIEMFVAPLYFGIALVVLAVWISAIAGLVTLFQHTTITFH